MNRTVAAHALGWRNAIGAVNRTHGPVRLVNDNYSFLKGLSNDKLFFHEQTCSFPESHWLSGD